MRARSMARRRPNTPGSGVAGATSHTVTMGDGDVRYEWSTRFARAIAEELRQGVASGAMSRFEADQLLNRMRTVVEQALEPAPILG